MDKIYRWDNISTIKFCGSYTIKKLISAVKLKTIRVKPETY